MSQQASHRLAVVGAGPAGCYVVRAALSSEAFAAIDVYDALPVPYGLLRYGVAPDHPRTKQVSRVLEKALAHPAVRFRGNRQLGVDLSVEYLQESHEVTVFATGADVDRRLGIPGDDLGGVVGSKAFVRWYTGHPDASVVSMSDVRSAVVVGGGNVALDIVRLMLSDEARLRATDMTANVVQELAAAPVQTVHLVIRRGALETKFSYAELTELDELADLDIIVDPAALSGLEATDSRTSGVLDIFRSWSRREATGASLQLRIWFGAQLGAVLADDSARVSHVRVEGSAQPPKTLPAQLVVTAIGQTSTALPGLPYDQAAGRIRSQGGRVIDDAGAPISGLYVAGWAKRGPSGVIGTNKACAVETMARVLEDLDTLSPATRDVQASAVGSVVEVDWAGWKRIEAFEAALAELRGHGTTAVKVVRRSDQLAIAAG